MNEQRDFDRAVDRWLNDGADATPPRVIHAVLLAAGSVPQERDVRISWRTPLMRTLAYAAAVLVAAAIGVTALALSPRFGIGPRPTPPEASLDLGIFEPVAGWIVYGHHGGIWGVDPTEPTNSVQLTSETGTPMGWSRDGTRLLITRGEHLFILHADGSETQVTVPPMEILGGATISPDGSRVVFAGAEGTLYAVDADGGPAERLLGPGEHMIQQPTFSPDGTRIAYTIGGGDHNNDVWAVNADGSDAHEILANEATAAAGHVRGLAWSPAGDLIALGLEGTIYTFAPDGSGFTRVSGLPGGRPYWSPDGSEIRIGERAWHPGRHVLDTPSTLPEEPFSDMGIFEQVAGRIIYYAESSLWAVDPTAPAEPPTRVQLTSGAFIPLAWSSDGTRLLMMRGNLREGLLFVLHADGTETQLTEQPTAIRGAAISPDGSRVVYARSQALYAVDADGGPAELLVESRIGILDDLAFSPDGMRIAYADGAGDNNHHVWVMNADGSDAHEIVSRDCACHVYGLAWSPAGDRIALGLEGRIYTFAADGSDFTQIAGGDTTCESARSCAVNLPSSAESPHWSPDGFQIAYTTGCADGAGSANRDGCNLAIVDADGSHMREFSYGASGPWHPGTLRTLP